MLLSERTVTSRHLASPGQMCVDSSFRNHQLRILLILSKMKIFSYESTVVFDTVFLFRRFPARFYIYVCVGVYLFIFMYI